RGVLRGPAVRHVHLPRARILDPDRLPARSAGPGPAELRGAGGARAGARHGGALHADTGQHDASGRGEALRHRAVNGMRGHETGQPGVSARAARALWLARRTSLAIPIVLGLGGRAALAQLRARAMREPASAVRRARWRREAESLRRLAIRMGGLM